jgi:L-cysteine/cystine lyase
VASLRNLLPVTSRCIYMNTGSSGPCPQPAVAAMNELQEWINATGPSAVEAYYRMGDAEQAARDSFAALLGCSPAEIALTHNTSEGVNIVLQGLGLRARDEIIITDLEHDSVLVPVYHLCATAGAAWRMLNLSHGADPVASLTDALSPEVRLVLVSHVSFCNGQVLPIREMTSVANAAGVPVMVDGAQGPGHVDVNVKELGVQFYAAPGQKWLLGPEGTGALYVADEWLERLTPRWVGWVSHTGFDLQGGYTLKPDCRRFEVGTRDPVVLLGLAESTRILTQFGMEAVHSRILTLSDLLRARLSQISGVILRSPTDGPARCGLIAFTMDGMHAKNITSALYKNARIVCRWILPPYPPVVRVSVNAFQTEDELNTLCDALSSLTKAG